MMDCNNELICGHCGEFAKIHVRKGRFFAARFIDGLPCCQAHLAASESEAIANWVRLQNCLAQDDDATPYLLRKWESVSPKRRILFLVVLDVFLIWWLTTIASMWITAVRTYRLFP